MYIFLNYLLWKNYNHKKFENMGHIVVLTIASGLVLILCISPRKGCNFTISLSFEYLPEAFRYIDTTSVYVIFCTKVNV